MASAPALALTPVCIRQSTLADGPAIAALVAQTFDRFVASDCTSEGADFFREFCSVGQVCARLSRGAFALTACREGSGLVGVLEMRDPGHISLFFVAATCLRQGVGRALMTALREHCLRTQPPVYLITVNASLFSVPVYERLGFCATNEAQTVNGIRFVAMQTQW